jgi:hypothetical protein
MEGLQVYSTPSWFAQLSTDYPHRLGPTVRYSDHLIQRRQSFLGDSKQRSDIFRWGRRLVPNLGIDPKTAQASVQTMHHLYLRTHDCTISQA